MLGRPVNVTYNNYTKFGGRENEEEDEEREYKDSHSLVNLHTITMEKYFLSSIPFAIRPLPDI